MSTSFRSLSFVVMLLASAPAAAAELYKWVDQNGVTNYSNSPPATTRGGKPPALVEDRLSVYTPEKSVTEAIERDKERRARPNGGASWARQAEPERKAAAVPPPPVAYDPCGNPSDPSCQGFLYDDSPVFHGRRRHQPLAQPQLPPGAIAGNVTGPGAYIPGQSATAQPPAPPPPSPPRRPVSRDKDRDGWGR